MGSIDSAFFALARARIERMRCLAIVVFAVVVPAQQQARPELQEILRRHTDSLGDAAALRGGDLYLGARVTRGGKQFRLHILVRRAPFAYREEWLPLAGEGEVFVSDGRHAWAPTHLPTGPARPGTPLVGPAAITVMEHAFCDGLLYLDPRFTDAGRANFDANIKLGVTRDLPAEIERDIDVQQTHFVTTAGTLLFFQFDPKDGRLLEIAQAEVEPSWFVRFGRWKKFGQFSLPSLRVAGRLDPRSNPGLDVVEIDEVRLVERHPDALFAGNPEQPLPRALDAGPLRLLPHTVPGHGHVVVTDMRVGSQPNVVMLVDTGADACAVTPRLAQVQQLLPLGRQALTTANGVAETRRAWIDEFVFGQRRVLQLPVSCLTLPAIFELPPDQAPQFLLGGAELLSGSPVLDFAAGRLWLRGAPVTPLTRFTGGEPAAEQPGERVVTIAFAAKRVGGDTLDVEIEIGGKRMPALFDTGFWVPLRLHQEALEHFGLPTDRATWLAQGAVPTRSVGAGGGGSDDLFATLPELRLGPILYERPIVQLTFLPAARAHRAILGCGALMACTRVGVDDERQVVELELGAGVARDAGGTWRVPAPGMTLGLSVGSPATVARGWPYSFPCIVEVSLGSAAARAGLVAGDRLVAIGGKSCEGLPAWSWNRSLWLQPGESVELTVRSNAGVERKVKLP